jgi:PKHD-type hydroxylase
MSAFSPTFPTPLGGQVIAWEGAFSAAEVDRIVALDDAQALERAQLNLDADPYGKKRITDIAWLTPATVPDSRWLHERLRQVAERLNTQYYQYALSPDFHEGLQYTVYNSGQGGHFDWHVDHGVRGLQPRKISISVQLSAPTDYEGCDLEFSFGDGILKGPRTRGTVIAFSSYVLHRVSPITSGVRKSLVAWVSGPDFR